MQFFGVNNLFFGAKADRTATTNLKFSASISSQKSIPSQNSLTAAIRGHKAADFDAISLEFTPNKNFSIESKEKATEAIERISELRAEQKTLANEFARNGKTPERQEAFLKLNDEITKIAETEFLGKKLMSANANESWVALNRFNLFVQERRLPNTSYDINRTYAALDSQVSSLETRKTDLAQKLEEEKKRVARDVELQKLKERKQSSAWGTETKGGSSSSNFIVPSGREDDISTAVEPEETRDQPQNSVELPPPSEAFQSKMASMLSKGAYSYDASKDIVVEPPPAEPPPVEPPPAEPPPVEPPPAEPPPEESGEAPAIGTFFIDGTDLYEVTESGNTLYTPNGETFLSLVINEFTSIIGYSYGEIQTISGENGIAYVWTKAAGDKGGDAWVKYMVA